MEQDPQGKLVSTWEAITKDDEGEAHIHTLHKYDHTIPEEVPDFINQAAPTRITPSRRSKASRVDELAILFPDAQIPFHDPRALQLAHLAVRELQPDRIIMLGDMMDFPAQSRFDTHPSHHQLIQSQLDQTHQMLAQVRADAPDARIDYIPGNHEYRLNKDIIQKNAELLGIKRANAASELGVLTLEFLLRMQELEVDMAGQYPNGGVWLNDHTVAIHGDTAASNGSTSLKYLIKNPNVSTIHGHSHRAEIQWRTTASYSGPVQRFAMSPGTLADTSGSVPSYGSSISEEGHPEVRVENWQQAVGLVEYNSEMANPELAMIANGIIRIRGNSYEIPRSD